MAKFNIEVELDWIEDEEFSIDEEIKRQVVSGVKERLLKKATDEAVKAVDTVILEKIEQAESVIQQRVDDFVEMVCAGKISEMKIPYKKSSWGSEVEYKPMGEFIGERYEAFLNRKVFDRDGNTPRYDSDKNTSLNEYFINKYLEKELASKVSEMIKKAKTESEEMVLRTLEQNLRDQLAVETINRLNIPKLLENLQLRAAELDEKEGLVNG
ncbi:hypothetical protein [Anaerotignum sp. MB30-C6]|uniref:hypothetical protein n=1 Tax=Anaerotignum sp. MB30-C6 TaxID=3070814 RepID=UPI0027DCA52B|nr:hypothetical protein [Anaerotignum sp. MB30-C6]WMI81807.1 hypothetical protein RBQ60_03510 [Anaerotignum sp. MB30-C6]